MIPLSLLISWLQILPFVWRLSIYSRANTPIKRKVETMTVLLEKTKNALLHKSPWQHAYWQSPPAIEIALQDILIQWQSLWGTQALPSTSCIMTPDWIWWWYFPQTIDTLSYFGHVTSDCSSSHFDCGYGRPSSNPLQWKHLRVFAGSTERKKATTKTRKTLQCKTLDFIIHDSAFTLLPLKTSYSISTWAVLLAFDFQLQAKGID